jgi:hypothetical protein
LNGTINKELVIQVGGAKKDFKNWYIDPKGINPRRKELLTDFKPTSANKNKRSPTLTQINKHLAAEMALLGIPVITSNPKNKRKVLLQNLEDKAGNKLFYKRSSSRFIKYESTKDLKNPQIKKYFEDIEDKYQNDKSWTIGYGYKITLDDKSTTGSAVQKVSDRTGTDAVIVNPDHLTDLMKKEIINDPAKLKKLIIDVTETSMKTKEWAVTLGTFYQNNPDLKKWFLYEAGSGLFKFTGTKSNGKSYKADLSPVANKIVVFKAEGLKSALYDFPLDFVPVNLNNPDPASYKNHFFKSGLF